MPLFPLERRSVYIAKAPSARRVLETRQKRTWVVPSCGAFPISWLEETNSHLDHGGFSETRELRSRVARLQNELGSSGLSEELLPVCDEAMHAHAVERKESHLHERPEGLGMVLGGLAFPEPELL